jgi:acetylornithine deacetylase
MVKASEKLLGEGVRDFGMLFVVGEERNSAGALVAAKASRGSRYLVNGEPTESKMALASKGLLRFELIARGKMAHSAYPELGESAIEKLLDALDAIRKVPLPDDPQLGPTTLNIGTISGGRAPNVIPDAAKAEILLRLVADAQPVRDLLAGAVGGRAELVEILSLPPIRLAGVDGLPTSIVSFATDVPVFGATWGQPLLFGPGSILVAHTTQERIAKGELAAAVDTYADVVQKLLARN